MKQGSSPGLQTACLWETCGHLGGVCGQFMVAGRKPQATSAQMEQVQPCSKTLRCVRVKGLALWDTGSSGSGHGGVRVLGASFLQQEPGRPGQQVGQHSQADTHLQHKTPLHGGWHLTLVLQEIPPLLSPTPRPSQA